MNTIKLLLLDVDGTLVTEFHKMPSDRVMRAIRKVADEKIEVTFATSRVHRDLKRIIDSLDLKTPYHVIETGAKIVSPRGEIKLFNGLEREDVELIINHVSGLPSRYDFCIDGEWKKGLKNFKYNSSVTTVSLISEDTEQTEEIVEALIPLEGEYQINLGKDSNLTANGSYIVISHRHANKEFGSNYVQEKLGISPEETLGIGDSPQDTQIFNASGFKIAVGNADEKLKKIADFVAPTVEEDGVATAIEKFILA